MPDIACANIVDELNLAPFIPIVLDSFMMIATRGYDFFVGDGDGIVYLLVWTFLGFSIVLYVFKMYFPSKWLSLFGFSGGGELVDGKVTARQITETIMRNGLRAVIAVVLLLQIRPVFLTKWLVNPFLELGSIYTHAITETINDSGSAPKIECPADIIDNGWLSAASCEFLVQPVSDLSHANNQIIKRGFEFITSGVRGLSMVIPSGGEDFLNIITGLLLIITFVGCNLFMALLIIQGIFNFGMQLILYPFNVFTYVVEKSNDKWFDVWPAFKNITKALQDLIITMIACAFMLCINLSVIKALFQWNTSVFVVAAGGSSYSNMPSVANSGMGFGEHSVTWLSALLTFYLFFKIFELTQQQLKKYSGGNMEGLYKSVTSDAKTLFSGAKNLGKQIGTAIGWVKK